MVVQKKMESLALGVDIGGTKVNVGLADAAGFLLNSHKAMIDSKEPETVLAHVAEGIEACLSKSGKEAKALGVGVAGQVDRDGVVRGSPNLGWRNVRLRQRLERQFGLPVAVANDVNAATWGEWRFGAGRGVDDLVVLFVGTGVGGGVISGGKLLTGCTNSGGELGHITIVSDGRKCHCPNKGCLEAYVGGWAIAERAQEMIRTLSLEGRRLLAVAGSVSQVTAVTVSQAFREGDLLARLLVEETGRYLAAGVVSIVNAFNPCVVALGGGVIDGIPELVHIVKNSVPALALEASVEELKIVKASLGSDAAVIGAAALAQDLVDKAP